MFFPRDALERARACHRQEPWSHAWEHLVVIESELARELPLRVDTRRHNWLLEQSRLYVKFLFSLLTCEQIAPSAHRRQLITSVVDDILGWPQWALDGDYDLSTAEILMALCATLEVADTVLDDAMTSRLRSIMRQRGLEPWRQQVAPRDGREPVWWWRDAGNWCAVCNSSAYVAGHYLGAGDILDLAWQGLTWFAEQQPADGGSRESLSYWQYGLRFLTYALLAHHHFTGREASLLQLPALRRSVHFFNTFAHQGAALGFGDCSHVPPEALLLRLCEMVGDDAGRRRLQANLVTFLTAPARAPADRYLWNQPRDAQALLYLQPATDIPSPPVSTTVFPETGWACLRAGPLSVSFRAGDNHGAHAMRDLLAVNVALDGVTLLGYTENHPYTAGWFNDTDEQTRTLYFEHHSTSKNTIAFNGIGQIRRAEAALRAQGDTVEAEAAVAYPKFVTAAHRRLARDGDSIILTDRTATRTPCWHEIRFFTRGDFTMLSATAVRVSMGKAALDLFFSADQRLAVRATTAEPSIGTRPDWRLLRVVTAEPVHSMHLETQLLPVPAATAARGQAAASADLNLL